MTDRTEPMPTQAMLLRHVDREGRVLALHPGLFNPVYTGERTYRKKPERGGLWTSTYWPTHPWCAWGDWCQDNGFGCGDLGLFTLEPEPTARVFEVNSYDDLELLFDRYGREPAEGEKLGLLYKSEAALIWEDIADDYDAVHLTDAGEADTRFSMPYDLYGWDCESTLWFRWAFVRHEDHGTIELKEHNWSDDESATAT